MFATVDWLLSKMWNEERNVKIGDTLTAGDQESTVLTDAEKNAVTNGQTMTCYITQEAENANLLDTQIKWTRQYGIFGPLGDSYAIATNGSGIEVALCVIPASLQTPATPAPQAVSSTK